MSHSILSFFRSFFKFSFSSLSLMISFVEAIWSAFLLSSSLFRADSVCSSMSFCCWIFSFRISMS